MATDKAVRFVAYLEATKGIVVLIAATGLASVIHEDAHEVVASLIKHAHFNPASQYPRIFLDAASQLGDTRLSLLAAGAVLYAMVRFIEAYGLYFERAWAELFAALSGAIYIPFELIGLVRELTWHGVGLLAVNVAVVGFMVRALFRRRRVPTPTST